MSADNWAVCPKCKQERMLKIEKLHKKIKDSYGEISEIDYLDLLKEVKEVVKESDDHTLREDYDIGTFDGDHFEVNYGALCEVCNFKFSYQYSMEDFKF